MRRAVLTSVTALLLVNIVAPLDADAKKPRREQRERSLFGHSAKDRAEALIPEPSPCPKRD